MMTGYPLSRMIAYTITGIKLPKMTGRTRRPTNGTLLAMYESPMFSNSK